MAQKTNYVMIQDIKVTVVEESYAASFIKDEEILLSGLEWITLAELGFPEVVLMEDGTVYNTYGGLIKKELKKTGRGKSKHLSITCSRIVTVKKEEHRVTKQFFVHQLLARFFLPKPEGSKTVAFVDENPQNISLDNLYWK